MFDNIDSKIKGLAVLYTIAGIIGSIAGASYYFIHGVALIGFLILIFGILASWIGSFMLYGFGADRFTQNSMTEIFLSA